MKFKIENLGILHSAELSLGDFTIICGKNNTGKTYATYALYGLLKSWRRLVKDLIPEHPLRQLLETGSAAVDLEDIVKNWESHVGAIAARYKDMLPAVLAADPERFTTSQIHLELPPPSDVLSPVIEGVKSREGRNEGALLSFKKTAGSSLMSFTVLRETLLSLPGEAVEVLANEVLQDYFFSNIFPNVFMASTERTGAAIFQGELNFSRTRLLEALAISIDGSRKLNAKDLLPAIFDEFNPRYAFPVRDGVDFINQLGSLTSQKSELSTGRPDILEELQDILGGEYKVSKTNVYFVPKKGRARLSLGESSSAVRSLVDIGFYLQHQAKKGDLFMIDEPELNLHPENQRRVARLLARIANFGIKVFITTHSDYIAKEINTLTLLARGNTPGFAERFHYRSDEALSADRIKLFVAHSTKIKKPGESARSINANVIEIVPPLEDGGFEWPSFDPTIAEQSRVQHEVWEALNC